MNEKKEKLVNKIMSVFEEEPNMKFNTAFEVLELTKEKLEDLLNRDGSK